MSDPRLKRHRLGFLEVVDRPTSEELSSYYSEMYYQTERGNYRSSYAELELSVILLRIAQRKAKALELIGCDEPGRMLDVGCGEGFVLKSFAEEGWEVAGIDFSLAGVEAMNPKIADLAEQGDIFSLLEARIAAGEQYNIVWLGNVLEHVLDPLGLMTSLRGLIKPGGLLIVTVPNDGSEYHEALYEAGDIDRRFWVAIPDHMSYFTSESLRAVSEATGWDCLALHGDFPIDLFLANECSNYVTHRSRGPSAHRARLSLERHIGNYGTEAANRFYTALAGVGLGRNLLAFLRPKPKGDQV
ncbi:MAG: class I SAM-dependent methyltransferase [Halioglobus sp.]